MQLAPTHNQWGCCDVLAVGQAAHTLSHLSYSAD